MNAIHLHYEVDGIASLAASEAFEYAFARGYGKGRGLFVVERAAGDIIRPPPFEGDEFAYHVHDLGGIQYFLYCFPVDHACIREQLLRIF